MGSKVGSKELMRAAGVPTLPSLTLEGEQLPEDADLEALGWPLLVKASAGGGGRGMREVGGPVSLRDAVAGARREAEAASSLRRGGTVADRVEFWHVEALLRLAEGDADALASLEP